jgi:hypothetical protein
LPTEFIYLFDGSPLASQSQLDNLLNRNTEDIVNAIQNDGLFLFYKEMLDLYTAEIAPNVTKYDNLISEGMEKYMAAQLEVFKDKRFYPMPTPLYVSPTEMSMAILRVMPSNTKIKPG